jgi:hypothetical protein
MQGNLRVIMGMRKSWIGAMRVSFATLLLSTVPIAAVSQHSPKPTSELNQLTFFAGAWSCRVRQTDSAAIEEFTWNVQRTLNDFWYIATVQAKQTSKPTTIQHEFLGYDTAGKKLLRTMVSDEGNLIDMNSSGWEANKFVWEGSVVTNGRKIPLREAITRKTATEFTANWEVRKTGEQWAVVSNETCTKLK